MDDKWGIPMILGNLRIVETHSPGLLFGVLHMLPRTSMMRTLFFDGRHGKLMENLLE